MVTLQSMKKIRVYRHRDCEACAKKAAFLRRLDWFDRTESSIEEPKNGQLRVGQVAVEDLRTGDLAYGALGFDRICRHIPMYAPLRFFLVFPAFRRVMEREMNGKE